MYDMETIPEAAREQVRSLLSETQLALHGAELDPALEGITLPLQEDLPTEDSEQFWRDVAWPSPKHKVTTLEPIPVAVRSDVSTLLGEIVSALVNALHDKDDHQLTIRCKQFLYFPRLIFGGHNNRGGRRGTATRARDVAQRLTSWRKGQWHELWTLATPPTRKLTAPALKTPQTTGDCS